MMLYHELHLDTLTPEIVMFTSGWRLLFTRKRLFCKHRFWSESASL